MWPRFHVAAHQTVLVAISHHLLPPTTTQDHQTTLLQVLLSCICLPFSLFGGFLFFSFSFLFADARLRHDLQIFTSLDTEPAINAELYSFLAGEQRESFLARCRYESETPAAH